MVHALEMSHSLLETDGLLIDIHPTGQPPLVEVHGAGKVHLAGQLHEKGDFVEYFQADDALTAVTGRGLFVLERKEPFSFLYHAPTIVALTDFFETEWLDAVLPEETSQRVAELLGGPGDDADDGREIVVREFVHISRFRKIGG